MRRLLAALLTFCLVAVVLAQPPKVDWPALNLNDAKLIKAGLELPSPATAVAALDAKSLLVVGCEDGRLHVWTRQEDKDWISATPKAVKAHAKTITALAAVGEMIVSASTDGKVHVWAVPPSDKPARTIDAKTVVRGVALSGDGKLLAVGGDDGKVQLFNPGDGKPVRVLSGSADWVLAVALSADGKQAAAGGVDGKLWAWDATTGTKRFDVLAQQPPAPKATVDTNVVSSIAFSPDGKQIVLGGSSGTLFAFQADNGKFIRAMPGHTSAVSGLWWHPGNLVLASSAKDRTLHLWAPATGGKLKTLPAHDAWGTGVTGLGKGTEAVTVGADRTVKLWSLGATKPKKK